LGIIIIISSSFFRTGCLFYPSISTCFDKNKIPWSEKEYLKEYSVDIKDFVKGFYHQNKTSYDKIENNKIYSSKYNWVKYWIELHFFYKIFEFLIIILLIYLISYIYFQRENQINKLKKIFNQKITLLFLSFVSIFFWFTLIPQFRFGFSFIIIFTYLILNLKFNKNINFNILLMLVIIFFNFKNFSRINSELNREDIYKFNNFPYFNEKQIVIDYKNVKIKNFLIFKIIEKLK
jgi:magnesium-transporting ATPase (P-type)